MKRICEWAMALLFSGVLLVQLVAIKLIAIAQRIVAI